MTRKQAIIFLVCAALLYAAGTFVIVSGGPPCEVVFEAKRQAGSTSMMNEVRPTERAQILNCGGTLRYHEEDL